MVSCRIRIGQGTLMFARGGRWGDHICYVGQRARDSCLMTLSRSPVLSAKNKADAAIAELMGRSSAPGNVGEFVAARVFAIELMPSGAHLGYDGMFATGPLAGQTVNIRAYCRHEYVLDISPHLATTTSS